MAKIPRNAPCPCGSGKKYKQCHLLEDAENARADRLAAQRSAEETPEASPLADGAAAPRATTELTADPVQNTNRNVKFLAVLGLILFGAVVLFFAGFPKWSVALVGCGIITLGIVFAATDPPPPRNDSGSAGQINFGRD